MNHIVSHKVFISRVIRLHFKAVMFQRQSVISNGIRINSLHRRLVEPMCRGLILCMHRWVSKVKVISPQVLLPVIIKHTSEPRVSLRQILEGILMRRHILIRVLLDRMSETKVVVFQSIGELLISLD